MPLQKPYRNRRWSSWVFWFQAAGFLQKRHQKTSQSLIYYLSQPRRIAAYNFSKTDKARKLFFNYNHSENEIKHLEGTKEKYSEEVDNIYNHIQEKQNKIDDLAANIANLEQQNYELLENIEKKEKQLNEYGNVNDKLYEENETLLKLIETNKFHADSLRTLHTPK